MTPGTWPPPLEPACNTGVARRVAEYLPPTERPNVSTLAYIVVNAQAYLEKSAFHLKTRTGRETMVRFEQFRHALGQIVGEADLQTPLPVRIFVFKNTKGWTTKDPLSEGRDRYAIVLGETRAVTPAIYSELSRLLLKSNTAQMPAAFESGLVAFYSTFEVNGIRIIVGAPPSKSDLDWARVHMMITDPDYFGKIRVLLYNLRHGVADDPAYRNAFGKPAAEVEAQARRHLAAGSFQTDATSIFDALHDSNPGVRTVEKSKVISLRAISIEYPQFDNVKIHQCERDCFADTAGTDQGNTTPLRVRDHVGGSPSKASRVGVVANQSIVPNHDGIDRSYFGSIWRQFVK
jgi:hypothetical protein